MNYTKKWVNYVQNWSLYSCKTYAAVSARLGLSLKSVKLSVAIGIMNSDTVVFWGTQCFSKREEGNVNTRVCAFFFLSRWNPSSFNQATVTTIIHNTFRHCRVRVSAFEGRPFSEHLYILAYIPSYYSLSCKWNRKLERRPQARKSRCLCQPRVIVPFSKCHRDISKLSVSANVICTETYR